ncbi:hypothetical protein AaE_007620 [Aphanomyces astaci]|uniref:FYVE-type domain-containing protein n=1 Tax=Aphanomyces astaci TaxID=112090 RepID=A0A6A5ADA4_APHAT|nr:hypothetical protein AaE_007620 [Aphanomyces astaci]
MCGLLNHPDTGVWRFSMKNIINPMKDRTWSSENGHVHTVLGEPEQDQIRQLFMNNHLSDVVLHFPAPDNSRSSHHEHYDGASTSTSLPAHRLLLSLRSGAFRTAFRESSTSYTSTVLGDKRLRLPLKMVIQDTPYVIFKELLRYIYTGTLQPPPVAPTANHEGVDTSKSLCTFWLELVKAATRGDIGVVSLLVHHGADITAVDEEGQTAFHVAAANGYASVVLVLLKMSEDRAMESKDITAADDASEPQRELDTDQPAFSIDADDYKSVSSTDCNTALHLAAMAPQGRVDKILQVLLENGADPNRPNWFGYTPLHLFCAHHDGPPSVVDMFIEHGTNIQMQGLDGSTPLHLAVGKASEAISIALVRAGAPVYVQDVADCDNRRIQGRSVVNLAESTSQGVMVVPLLLNVRTPPPWVTDDTVLECLSCGEGFGMATRKHHCRHCGRIVCATCSTNRIPLPKFDQVPAARVCDICFDVLSFRKLM